MTETTRQKLDEIFRFVLDMPTEADPSRVRRLTTAKWDSLAHVSLMAALESELGIILDTSDAERLTSYQAAVLLVDEKSQ